ncbi:hypothetical protein NDU88_004570 [Pleurodeles waltl]|uniref:Uncharacterized protein n=1 Tax=Pleurodeles waltl TaxID=8319 RepID=A0AAV7MAA6_PLEWA|nr:hypothetical protein NDU88_004570 [Pleurodeles waltl]
MAPHSLPELTIRSRWPQCSPPQCHADKAPCALSGGVYADFKMAASSWIFRSFWHGQWASKPPAARSLDPTRP